MTRPQLKVLRILFRHAGACCPRLLARWGIYLWGKTHRPAWRQWEHEILASASRESLSTEHGQVTVYRWGRGKKKILLLPGWNSRASHFRSFIKPLLAPDYQVIGIDPPAHGNSPGNWTNIRHYLAAIEVVSKHSGSFEAVIGHSFGGFCVPFALDRLLLARKAILLATPVSLDWLFVRFCDIIDAAPSVRLHMKHRVERLLGNNCWQYYDVRNQGPKFSTVPVLIVHDDQDSGVPCEHARDIQASWPGSELLVTHKLGHQRLLRHPDSINPIIAFIHQD